MKIKLPAIIGAAAIAAACLPLLSGCSAKSAYTLNVDGDGNKYYVASCSGLASALGGELVIPAYYGEGDDYAPVTEIAEQGFSGTGLTKVTVPYTVTKIGTAAFAYSNYLTEVVFEDGSELEEIEQGVFGYCGSLAKIELPSSVKTVGYLAFCSCAGLSEITLPAVETISARAFEECTSLKNITLPATLVSIGARAFYASALEEVVIPDSVRDTEVDGEVVPAVGYAAFHSCINLARASVGAGVTEIKSGVFGYCPSLKEITLPATLEKIEGARYTDSGFYCGHAFHNNLDADGNTVLKDIYYGGTQEQWEKLKKNIDGGIVEESGVTFDNSAVFKAEVHFKE